jgi:4-amino-4-deoxy-L-arabinose transferase-like glycosyltransferase
MNAQKERLLAVIGCMKLSFNRALDHWWKNKKERPALAWMSILWLLLIGWLAFFWNLGTIGLVDETEPLFAEAARQMTLTGDWITPFFDGKTRFDKPPLIYWLMAIAYRTLGVNEWAVRLPSALAAMGLVCLGFYTLWVFGVPSPRSSVQSTRHWFCAGLGSALIALNPETIVWARTGVSDMLLTGCMAGALLSFFLGYAQPSKPAVQKRWYLAFYVLIALAILTKGPVGIVLPGLIIGSFLLYLGNALEVLREMRLLLGTLLIVAIALPWYVLVIARNGSAYINSFFGYHNLERFTEVVNGHAAPWYFYFLVVLLGFAPWSIYLPLAIARLRFWERSHWRSSHRSTHLGLFALFWFVGIFGFFTIAVTKLPSYVLPLMPAAAILVALLFSAEFFKTSKNAAKNSKLLLVSGWLNVVFLLVIAGALFYLPYLIGSDPAIPNLHELIQQSGLPVWGGVIWAITALVVAVLLLRRQWHWLWSVNLLGFMAFLIFVLTPAYFLVDQARQLPLRELSAIASKVDQPGEELIMIGFQKPSVVFYSQRPVTYIKVTEDGAAHIQKWANGATYPHSVLVLTQPKKLKKLGLQPEQYQDLAKAGAYQLIRVFKNPSKN